MLRRSGRGEDNDGGTPLESGLAVQASPEIDRGRRKFLVMAIGILTSLMGVALGIPLVSSLITPGTRKTKQAWSRVAGLDSLPEGQPVRLNFTAQTEEAYQREATLYSVWIIKRSPSEVIAFSPICTHLGCYYNWNPLNSHFECPCHASVFSLDGKVLAGPAPRPLDTLPLKVDKGTVYVAWERFKVGIPGKIPVQEAEWYRTSGIG